MDLVELDLSDGSRCRINLFGATVQSWICHNEEMLFLSSKSLFDNKKAIRGGIPVVFPNFGPWAVGPQHGFARINKWSVAHGPEKAADGHSTSARLELVDNEETRKLWNYKFKLEYVVTLTSDSLTTQLIVNNTGSDAFSFTCLLHTYLQVPDITNVTVSGLKGVTYNDTLEGKMKVEDRELLKIGANVDSVYQQTPDECVINNVVGGRQVVLKKDNLPDTVVWNPWQKKAAEMSDFDNEEYLNMICVEAGYVVEKKELAPGATFSSGQTLLAKI